MTDEQRVSLLLQELTGLLTDFRERCAQEADREVATCKHLGHDDYYPRMAAVHIREIDVHEWLKKYHVLQSSVPMPSTDLMTEKERRWLGDVQLAADAPVEYAVDQDTTAVYCKLRSGRIMRRYAMGPAWGRGWAGANESLVSPALTWHPVTPLALDTVLAGVTE